MTNKCTFCIIIREHLLKQTICSVKKKPVQLLRMNSSPSFKEADYRSVYSLESGYLSVLTLFSKFAVVKCLAFICADNNFFLFLYYRNQRLLFLPFCIMMRTTSQIFTQTAEISYKFRQQCHVIGQSTKKGHDYLLNTLGHI